MCILPAKLVNFLEVLPRELIGTMCWPAVPPDLQPKPSPYQLKLTILTRCEPHMDQNLLLSEKVFLSNPKLKVNMTSTTVGFDMKMTLHHPTIISSHPIQELYSRSRIIISQCKAIRLSETSIFDYLRQVSWTILDNYIILNY